MYPMPDNTKVVLCVVDGEVRAKASNIDPALTVVVVNNTVAFEREALGMSFNSTRAAAPAWVAASKKS